MRPELITFDCYGTLIDWRGGILRTVHREVPESSETDDEEIFSAFGTIENEIEAGAYRPYREVLRETGRRLAERFDWEIGVDEEYYLADSLPSWGPFDDTNVSLEALRSLGYRLGIVSNVDDDLLSGTLHNLTIDFDLLVTAEKVKSYKPAPDHFRKVLESVAGETDRVLHVAASHYHDVRAAVPLGIPVVWVNREGIDPPGPPEPTVEVPDLRGMVEWLEGSG